MLKRGIIFSMVDSIISLLLLFTLYVWSAYKLHLATFLADREIFNFFVLYVPTLLFFASLFVNLEDTFKEVKKTAVVFTRTGCSLQNRMVRAVV